MNNFVIYKHTSPSGKAYIGQTNDYKARSRSHKSTQYCKAFSNAIKKYGWDNFKHEILIDGLSKEEANNMEKVLIEQHKTQVPNGYNLMSGGGSSTHSEETKIKMSLAKLGVKHDDKRRLKKSETNKGRVLSQETKLKISNSLKGHAVSKETKLKLSEKNKGNTYAKGYKHSSEDKLKMTEIAIGRKHSEETKKKISESHKKRQELIKLSKINGSLE